jgi:hypothetical protein
MARTWSLAAVLALWLGVLLGCTVSRPGTLQKMPGGPIVELTVTVAANAASVQGIDARTGERLEGSFREERTPDTSAAPRVDVVPADGSPALQSARDTTLKLVGTLDGDRGTHLRCSLEVQRRVLIRGEGWCRPVDRSDEASFYHLKF